MTITKETEELPDKELSRGELWLEEMEPVCSVFLFWCDLVLCHASTLNKIYLFN